MLDQPGQGGRAPELVEIGRDGAVSEDNVAVRRVKLIAAWYKVGGLYNFIWTAIECQIDGI